MAGPNNTDSGTFPAAISLATSSLLITLLIIPPMCWHYRNRNIGATILFAWIVYLNFQSFLNAVIWPSDSALNGFEGQGLCDVEVKLQMASEVGIPAALGCVLRALANVMDTTRACVTQTKHQRRRGYIIDCCWCIIPPVLEMFLHYIVQPLRYYLFGIAGCVPPVSNSYLTVVLIYIPPMIWTVVDTYFALIIIVRVYRYRAALSSILVNSTTNKARFFRLYILCIVWVIGCVPTQAYVLYTNLDIFHTSYSWSDVHNPETFNAYISVPSGGKVVYDRYIWLASGITAFVFFGTGKEAWVMYRSGLLKIGAGQLFPVLRRNQTPIEHGSPSPRANRIGSIGSKAKLIFLRKSSVTTATTTSSISQSSQAMSTTQPSSFEEPNLLLDSVESGVFVSSHHEGVYSNTPDGCP